MPINSGIFPGRLPLSFCCAVLELMACPIKCSSSDVEYTLLRSISIITCPSLKVSLKMNITDCLKIFATYVTPYHSLVIFNWFFPRKLHTNASCFLKQWQSSCKSDQCKKDFALYHYFAISFVGLVAHWDNTAM